MMDILKASEITGEILKFLSKTEYLPDEKIVGLKTAAQMIGNVLAAEALAEALKVMIANRSVGVGDETLLRPKGRTG